MKLFYSLFLFLFIVTSCRPKNSSKRLDFSTSNTKNTSNTSQGWSQQDREKFSSWCGGLSKKADKGYCNCALEAVQKIFGSYDEVLRMVKADKTESSDNMSATDNRKHSDFENAMGKCDGESDPENSDEEKKIKRFNSYKSNTPEGSGWSQQDKDVIRDYCNLGKSHIQYPCYLDLAMKYFNSYNEWRRIMVDSAFEEDKLSATDRQKNDEFIHISDPCYIKNTE